MIDFEIPNILVRIGLAASFFSNFLMIYLTLFHIKKLTGTYKKMVIMFAICGIMFTSVEVIARPFSHNYNKSVIYFSLNTYLSPRTLQIFLVLWAGFFSGITGLIAIQFIYRFLCLCHIKKAKKFERMSNIIWMVYPLIPGGLFGSSFILFCIPDKYTDDYMKEIIFDTYGFVIGELSRFIIIPYDSDDCLRWKNLFPLLLGVFLVWFHYVIMLYCVFKMHFNMKKELIKFSVRHRKLHKQFFYALVAQSLGPTVLMALPVAPIFIAPLISPYIDLEISWQTGWLHLLFGLYPPFDSCAFILIVSEYRKVVKSE
uniref:Seven TM Receptor n=1 Tax=Caenorhabditis tropicalis TaxID=1561998 RepID=A0A1I7T215_9PELO